MPKRRSPARTKTSKRPKKLSAQKHAVSIIQAIYRLARSEKLLDAKIIDPTRDMLRDALRQRDTGLISEWLLTIFSLQGVSDRLALEYMRRNGKPSWKSMITELDRKPSCPKLKSYWHYAACSYSKSLRTCAQPGHFRCCPVPKALLRNGRLNQTSWSFLLFVRDVAGGDLVKWLDARIRHTGSTPQTIHADRERLLTPLNGVIGVSRKVNSMAFSDLLLAAPPRWRRWRQLGGALVVIDSLVHNQMTRSGILARYRAEHRYGSACYQSGGCSDIIDHVAQKIGASPRHTTHALWRFCSLDGFNICNGTRIDDRKRCENIYCRLYGICDRRPLHVT